MENMHTDVRVWRVNLNPGWFQFRCMAEEKVCVFKISQGVYRSEVIVTRFLINTQLKIDPTRFFSLLVDYACALIA